MELWDSVPQVQSSPEPELKTVVKEEAADIAVKKKPVEKEPPKKEVVKETPKVVKPPPPKEKEQPKKAEAPKALSPAEIKANAAAEKVRADQLARKPFNLTSLHSNGDASQKKRVLNAPLVFH